MPSLTSPTRTISSISARKRRVPRYRFIGKVCESVKRTRAGRWNGRIGARRWGLRILFPAALHRAPMPEVVRMGQGEPERARIAVVGCGGAGCNVLQQVPADLVTRKC